MQFVFGCHPRNLQNQHRNPLVLWRKECRVGHKGHRRGIKQKKHLQLKIGLGVTKR